MINRDEHQKASVAKLIEAACSHLSVVGCAVTGYGKTAVSTMLVKDWAVANGMAWEFIVNRRALLDQAIEVFSTTEYPDGRKGPGLDFGVRAAGYRSQRDLDKPGQVTIAQSDAGAIRAGVWKEHRPQLLIVDEIHASLNAYVQRRIREHVDRGFPVIGLTATPVGLGGHFRHLEVMCRLSELRDMGGALMARCHTPSEVDMKDVRKIAVPGKIHEEMGRRFMQQQVVGSILEHWRKLNPQGKPTIQFNPCLESSKWFTEQWIANGVPAAHCDGEHIYYGIKKDGERQYVQSNRKTRAQLKREVRKGLVKVVNNRFVLRTGIDWTFLHHAIYATKMGNAVQWVQANGRILRSHPGMEYVVVQDHGSNIFTPGLGSPNADREWSLDDTPQSIRAEAKERLRKGEDHQPVCCPQCHRPVQWEVWTKHGNTCPYCKRQFDAGSRIVIQTNGELREVNGYAETINVRVESFAADAQRAWNKLYYPSKNSKSPRSSTFSQIGARFNKQYPNYLVTSGYAEINGKKTKVSGIKDCATGQFHAIDNIPAPSSPVWKQAVKKTRAGALQHGHVKVTEKQGPGREPIPGNREKKAEPRRPAADRDLFNQGE